MKEGDRFGRLVVRELITGAEAGRPSSGTWARVRCDCGARLLVMARHLTFRAKPTNKSRRSGKYGVSCGCALPFHLRRMIDCARNAMREAREDRAA